MYINVATLLHLEYVYLIKNRVNIFSLKFYLTPKAKLQELYDNGTLQSYKWYILFLDFLTFQGAALLFVSVKKNVKYIFFN